jgi:hypothetical protein
MGDLRRCDSDVCLDESAAGYPGLNCISICRLSQVNCVWVKGVGSRYDFLPYLRNSEATIGLRSN